MAHKSMNESTFRRDKDDRVNKLYDEHEYMEAYRRHTDMRVSVDPQAAVGSMWDEIGKVQFDFMINMGLEPRHQILDLGCGTLRGGRHFIRYLDNNKYTGLDISPKALEAAEKLIVDEELANKAPRLLLNSNQNLRFDEFGEDKFDYILAQSVFTHLFPETIEECFACIKK